MAHHFHNAHRSRLHNSIPGWVVKRRGRWLCGRRDASRRRWRDTARRSGRGHRLVQLLPQFSEHKHPPPVVHLLIVRGRWRVLCPHDRSIHSPHAGANDRVRCRARPVRHPNVVLSGAWALFRWKAHTRTSRRVSTAVLCENRCALAPHTSSHDLIQRSHRTTCTMDNNPE